MESFDAALRATKGGKRLAFPLGFCLTVCDESVQAYSDLSWLGLIGFGNLYFKYSVPISRSDAIVFHGLRHVEGSRKFTRSTRWYSTPLAGSSTFLSPLSVNIPSFTSVLRSSFLIPGSSARTRYESLLSRMSTGGYQTPVAALCCARVRPNVSS